MFAIDHRNFDDRNIESPATEVIDRDLGVPFALIHAESERRCGWLIDDALHIEPCNAARVLRRLALRIIKIRRHGDDRFCHVFAEIIFGGFLHFHQHTRGDFRRRHFLTARLHPRIAVVGADDFVRHHVYVALHDFIFELAPDQSLDRKQSILRIGHRLAFGCLPHQDFVIVAERDNRWCGPRAFAVFDNLGLAAFEHRDARVGGAEIDTNNFCHDEPFLICNL